MSITTWTCGVKRMSLALVTIFRVKRCTTRIFGGRFFDVARHVEESAAEDPRGAPFYTEDGDQRQGHSLHAARPGGDGHGRVGSALAQVRFVPRLREGGAGACLLYTSPSPRDRQKSRMPSSA